MAASSSDYFMKVGYSTATTLSSPGYTTGATSINIGTTASIPTDTGVYVMIDETETNADGETVRVSGTYNVFRGVVSSATQISSLVYEGGDANRNYSAGATTRVYITVSKFQMNRLIDGLLVSHDQDGTLKDDSVDTDQIVDEAITNAKLDTSTGELGGAWQTWVPTPSGYSSNPTNTSYTYRKVGKTVTLQLCEGTNGTSNSTTKTYTLPFTAATRTNARWTGFAQVVNSGVGDTSFAELTIGSNGTTVEVLRAAASTAFTASGACRVVQGQITYEIA